jgi:hypothetical protein
MEKPAIPGLEFWCLVAKLLEYIVVLSHPPITCFAKAVMGYLALFKYQHKMAIKIEESEGCPKSNMRE